MSTYVTVLAKKFNLIKVDATKSVSIDVFPKDVKNAILKDSSACALSRAALRQLDIDGAIFFRSAVWLLKKGTLVRYLLDEKGQEQIKLFDRKQGFASGTYRLLAPAKSQTMAQVKARSKKRMGRHQPGKSGIKRKIVHHATDVRTTHMPQLPFGLSITA
jgi:hypothetical protein